MIKQMRASYFHNFKNAQYCALSSDPIPDYLENGDQVYIIDQGKIYYWDELSSSLYEYKGGGEGGSGGSSSFIPCFGSLATVQLGTTWSGDDPYTSTVTVTGYTVTSKTMVSVLPSDDVIEQMLTDGITNIFITNNDGVLTATAIGAIPTVPMTLQVLCTESDISGDIAELPSIVGSGVIETVEADNLTDAVNILGNEVSELTRQLSDETTGLDTKAPVILETASGAIASFDDGADSMPVKKLVAQIEPVQDLHGYDHPWPAGGGKNKLKTGGLIQGAPSDASFGNTTKRTFTIGTFVTNLTPNNYYLPSRVQEVSVSENSVSVRTDAPAYGVSIPITGLTIGSTYTFSSVNTNGEMRASFYKEDGTFISDTERPQTKVTVPAEAYYTLIHFNSITDDTQATFTNIQLELGSTATSYAPYSNICPISGWTGAEVTRTGKNLFDVSSYPITDGKYVNYITGGISSTQSFACTEGFIPCKHLQGKTVTLNKNGGGYTPGIAFYTEANATSYISGISDNGATAGTPITFAVPSNANYMRMTVALGETNLQLELGSTATDYEPYTGATIPITFSTEAGTVYGGTLDEVNGKLVVDRAITTVGALSWSYYGGAVYTTINGKKVGTQDVISKLLSDEYKTNTPVANMGDVSGWNDMAIRDSYSSSVVYIKDTNYTSAKNFKAAKANVQICYELATPIEYTLDGEELTTLYGVNNIWTDVGEVSVNYPADTKLYIDNKIATAVANALNA